VRRFNREVNKTAPEEMTTYAGFLNPPDSYTVIAMICCCCGPMDKGEEVIHDLKSFGSPLQDMLVPMPYVAQQGMFDRGFLAGPTAPKPTLSQILRRGNRCLRRVRGDQTFSAVGSPLFRRSVMLPAELLPALRL